MRAPVVVAVALLLAACGSDGSAGSGGASSGTEGRLTVAAATSLRDAFEEIGDDFTASHPGVAVTFDFDASSRLSARLLEGAPADVFASADAANLDRLADEDLLAAAPVGFAANELAIVTRPGNPEGIAELADLADVGVVSLCGEAVPCGAYAERALADAGVAIAERRITRGQNAGATLTAVAAGDAVAGIVYATDARAAGDAVEVVEIPAADDVVAAYPIAVLRSAGDAELAEAFVAHVLGPRGQAVLADHGFLAPT